MCSANPLPHVGPNYDFNPKRQRVERQHARDKGYFPLASQLATNSENSAASALLSIQPDGFHAVGSSAECPPADRAHRVPCMQRVRNQAQDNSNRVSIPGGGKQRGTARIPSIVSPEGTIQKGRHCSPTDISTGPAPTPSIRLQWLASEQAGGGEVSQDPESLVGKAVHGVVESWNGTSFVVAVRTNGGVLRGVRPKQPTEIIH